MKLNRIFTRVRPYQGNREERISAAVYCDKHSISESADAGPYDFYFLLAATSILVQERLHKKGIGPCEFAERVIIELEEPFFIYYPKKLWRWLTKCLSDADFMLQLSCLDSGSE